MDDETRAALELTPEELREMRRAGRPTGVAKVPPAPSLVAVTYTLTTTTFGDGVPGTPWSTEGEDVVDVGEPIVLT